MATRKLKMLSKGDNVEEQEVEAMIKEHRKTVRKEIENLSAIQVPEELEAIEINGVVILNDGSNIVKLLYALGENMKNFSQYYNDWLFPLALRSDLEGLEGLYVTASMDSRHPVTLAAIYFKEAAKLNPDINISEGENISIEFKYKKIKDT